MIKASELLIYSKGKKMIAVIVKGIFKHEKNQFIDMVKLNFLTVYQKSLVRRKVSHCLKVFVIKL